MKRVLALSALALVPILAAGCGGSRRCSRPGELILRAVPTNGQSVTAAGMQIAQQIIENRVQTLGVSSPAVSVHGDEIVVEFGGVLHPFEVAKTIGERGQLQLFDFEPSLAPPTVIGNQQPAPVSSLYGLLGAVQKEADKGAPESYYLFKTTASHPVLQGPAPTVHQLLLPFKRGKQPPQTQILKVPANREPVFCRGAADCPGAGRNGTSTSGVYWYLFKLPPALTGKDLVESGIAANVDQNSGQPIVTLQFSGHGSKEFKRITEAEYNRGRLDAGQAGQLNPNGGRGAVQSVINRYSGHNAVVLDGRLVQTPYIDYTDAALSRGIVGNAQITEPSSAAANRTALVLQSGSLPYRFEQVKLTTCSH
jgi:preprotein translocase subunit SecD